MEVKENERLSYHLQQVLARNRIFEKASQSVSRMILEKGIEKIFRAGKTVLEFNFFREGERPIVGWHQEINTIVNFIKDDAEGGSSQERALVLIGEPGNGKTFIIEEFLCKKYEKFTSRPENRRYTIEFINLDQLKGYGAFQVIQSQTCEDPLVFAMNLFESKQENQEYLSRAGFKDTGEISIERFYRLYRPLAPCSRFIWNQIREHCGGDIKKELEYVRIVPAPISHNDGALTGKYSARDKITSSADDLLGKRDTMRMMQLAEIPNHPYLYNVRIGAIARVGGGGIHFSDEIFRNKKDFVQIYLQVIQGRAIELHGYKWPIDCLIIGTSNNDVYREFVADQGEKPIKDRCQVCYVAHNTDYKLQAKLTGYIIGSSEKKSLFDKPLHHDPNLNYALSVGVVLTRFPPSESLKLNAVEMMKLEAGETAGEKDVKDLIEIKEQCNANPDPTKRWGQIGVGYRSEGRAYNNLLAMTETQEGECLFAYDAFKALEREILDFFTDDAVGREKCLKDLENAKKLYRKKIKTDIFNAFRDDPQAVQKDIMNYINMIVAIGSKEVGPDNQARYRDPQTGQLKPLTIDETFINAVEARMGLHTKETKDNFRDTIRSRYAYRITIDPNCTFADDQKLMDAVTEVKIQSDVAGSAGLAGALANRQNEENQDIYNRVVNAMVKKLGYCIKTCAPKTIEYFLKPVDE